MVNRYFVSFRYLISSLSPKIQCNNSLQSNSEQQKNMCFKQNVTMTLYKKWIELFQAAKRQETRYPNNCAPRKIARRLGLGFRSRSGLVLGLGGNQTIASEENWPLLELGFDLGLVLGLGGIFLWGNCPRTWKFFATDKKKRTFF